MKIEGTFAFDENENLYGFPPFDDQTLRGGELTRTVVFTPADTERYASASCTVTVTVHKLTVYEIWGTYIDITNKKIGTPFSELGLSNDLSFYALRGGVRCDSTYQGAVVWNESDYDPNEPHEQTITGTLAIIEAWKDNFEEPNPPIKTSVKVKLQYDLVTPTIVTPPVFRWSKGDFQLGDNRIFVGDYLETGTTKKLGEADATAELVGGEAQLNGQKIDGTFALVSPRPKWTDHVGAYTVKVIFTPEDTVLYAQAECTIDIEAIKRTVARVDYLPKSVTDKPVGTAFEDLEMFGMASFWTEDGSYFSGVNVTWDESTYDPNSEAEQIVTGTLDLKYISEYVQQPDPELKAKVRVKLLHVYAYTQKIQKPEALKTSADCLGDAVYYLSCACGEVSKNEADTFTAEGTALDHAWAAWTQNEDGRTHTRVCTRDASHTETGDCRGGQATCTAQAVCEDCRAAYGEALDHNWLEDWGRDTDKHWHECARCHKKKDAAEHDFGEGDACVTCGYQRAHVHRLTFVQVQEATCTQDGHTAYYTCSGCSAWFMDATGAVEITDKNTVSIPASGHAFGSWQFDAAEHWKTCGKCQLEADRASHSFEAIVDRPAAEGVKGEQHEECTVCGYSKEPTKIPALPIIITHIDAKITAPALGEKASFTAAFTTQPEGSVGLELFFWYMIPADQFTGQAGDRWLSMPEEDSPVFQTGYYYAVELYAGANDGYVFADSVVKTVNGQPHDTTYSGNGNETSAYLAFVFAPLTEHTHAFGAWHSDATDHWHECATCGEQADKAPHTESGWMIDREVTETEAGSKHTECTVCGRVLRTEEIPATGHAFGDWQSDETDHWHECAACGEQADKAAHEFKWVIDRRPTAAQKGSRHEECIICGHQRAAVEIPATGAADVPKTGDCGRKALGYALLASVLGLLGAACLGKKKRVR